MLPLVTPRPRFGPRARGGRDQWEAGLGGEGSTGSSYLPGGSKEAAAAGSTKEEDEVHVTRLERAEASPVPQSQPPVATCSHPHPSPTGGPAHHGHVDVVRVARVVVSASSCFCGLGLGCKGKHIGAKPPLLF